MSAVVAVSGKTKNEDQHKKSNNDNITLQKRVIAIDRFRGIAVFCMIVFQFIARFDSFGFLTRLSSHKIGVGIPIVEGMVLADIIAPMFMFAVGLSFKLSYDKQKELYGKEVANKNFIIRYMVLLGLGAVHSVIGNMINFLDGKVPNNIDYVFIVGSAFALVVAFALLISDIQSLKKFKKYIKPVFTYSLIVLGSLVIISSLYDFAVLNSDINSPTYGYWNILQSIGFAGLVALPIINQNLKRKVLYAIGLLTIFTYYYLQGINNELLDVIVQGGIFGAISWAVLIIAGTIFIELFFKSKKTYLASLLLLVAPAILFYFLIEVRKGAVSPSYTIINVVISGALFLIVSLFDRIKCIKYDLLASWGKYPLLLYILVGLIPDGMLDFLPDSAVVDAPLWLAILFVIGLLSFATLLIHLLNQKSRKKHIIYNK